MFYLNTQSNVSFEICFLVPVPPSQLCVHYFKHADQPSVHRFLAAMVDTRGLRHSNKQVWYALRTLHQTLYLSYVMEMGDDALCRVHTVIAFILRRLVYFFNPRPTWSLLCPLCKCLPILPLTLTLTYLIFAVDDSSSSSSPGPLPHCVLPVQGKKG
jgi:hypothetical protein